MHDCDCSFTPTELTKFSPFARYEAGYNCKASTGLQEIGVTCSSCKYFGKGNRILNNDYEYYESMNHLELGESDHCHVVEGPISSKGFCRFWTSNEQETLLSTLEEFSQSSSDLQACNHLINETSLSVEEFEQKIQDLFNTVVKSTPLGNPNE